MNKSNIISESASLRLRNAVKEGDITELEKLYSTGIDINADIPILYGMFLMTPIEVCVSSSITLGNKYKKNAVQAIKWFIGQGVSVESLSDQGHTPLMISAGENDHYMTDALIRLGADVNALGDNGHTCLHILAGCTWNSNLKETLRLLFKAGADANIADYDNNTPIHFAKDLPMANLLIKNGAKLDVVNNEGLLPEDSLKNHGFWATANELRKRRLEEEEKFICQGLPAATVKPRPRVRM